MHSIRQLQEYLSSPLQYFPIHNLTYLEFYVNSHGMFPIFNLLTN